MKKVGLLAALGIVIAGCAELRIGGPQVVGSGKVAKESRNLAPYHRVEVRGSADVSIVCGSDGKAELEADDNILPIITTEVQNDTLVISTSKGYSTHNPVKISLATAHLQDFSLSGSGNVNITGVHEKSLALALAGSGEVTAAGEPGALSVSLAGSGEYHLDKLRASSAAVSITGSGSADVNVTGELTASIHGSGEVTYAGDPTKVTKNVSGSGSVSRAER